MSKTSNLIFVDCEATGKCPGMGELTEFGAVAYPSRETFHGILYDSIPDPINPALSVTVDKKYDAVEVFTKFDEWLTKVSGGGRIIFVSD